MDPITRTLIILEWIFVKGLLIVGFILLFIVKFQQARKKRKRQSSALLPHETANAILDEYHNALYTVPLDEVKIQPKQNTGYVRVSTAVVKQNSYLLAATKKPELHMLMTKGWQFWLSWLLLLTFTLYLVFLPILGLINLRVLSIGIPLIFCYAFNSLWLWWMIAYKAEIKNGKLTITAPLQKQISVKLDYILALQMTSYDLEVRGTPILWYRKNIRIYTRGSHYLLLTSYAGNRREFTQALIDTVKEVNPDVAVSENLP